MLTRIGPLLRLRMAVHAAYLRLRIAVRAAYLRLLMRSCEQDILWHQEAQVMAPKLEALARRRLDELRIELIDCELCTRTN
jgi:hypothetical protein